MDISEILETVWELIKIFFEFLYEITLANMVYGIGELMEKSEKRKEKNNQRRKH